jgi:nucleoside-diphosphate-sugar epimerase
VGYLGRRVASLWKSRPGGCFGTTRSPERFEEIRSLGLTPVRYDVLQGGDALPAVDTVVYNVGFDRSQGRSQREVYVEGLRRTLALLPRPRLFIYVSSTGVYGNHEGGLVDELTPPAPVDAGGEACWEAEQLLADWSIREGWSSVVLRLAGIYGPGRWIGVERLRRGEAIGADPLGWLNLIHVEDAASVVVAAGERCSGGELFVVSDGKPVIRRDFYSRLAALAGTGEPIFDPSQAARHRGDRRINPARMLRELEVSLRFGDFETAWRCEHES